MFFYSKANMHPAHLQGFGGYVITQNQLKELLHYDPDIGRFTWLASRGRVKIGDIAGCKNNHGYICIRIDEKKYKAHRLSFLYMKGFMPDQTDHINHIRDDNRWSNLRGATNKENHKNLSMRQDNTSGYTGVCWFKLAKKWLACIKIDGKTKHLGLFTSKAEAAHARKSAEKKYGFHPSHGAQL